MNVTELSGTALGGLVFLPACVEADTPLLVYLHGAGERGTRTDHMCRHGIPRLIGKYLPSCFARNARRNSYGTMWCGRSSP